MSAIRRALDRLWRSDIDADAQPLIRVLDRVLPVGVFALLLMAIADGLRAFMEITRFLSGWLTWLRTLFVAVLLLGVTVAPAQADFYSAESICNRGDIYFCDDFDTIVYNSTTQGWWDWVDLARHPQVATDVNYPSGTGQSIRLELAEATTTDPNDQGTSAMSTGSIRHRYPDLGDGETLYVRFYWRASKSGGLVIQDPSPYVSAFSNVPGGSGAKLFYFFSYLYSQPYPAVGGNGQLNHRIRWELYNPTGNNAGPFTDTTKARVQWDVNDVQFADNVAHDNIPLDGTWTCIELYMKVSTYSGSVPAVIGNHGNSDGEVKWWFNDVLQGSWIGVDNRAKQFDTNDSGTIPASGDVSKPFNTVNLDMYFGGLERNLHPAQGGYYDNIAASTNRIGCIGAAPPAISRIRGLVAGFAALALLSMSRAAAGWLLASMGQQ